MPVEVCGNQQTALTMHHDGAALSSAALHHFKEFCYESFEIRSTTSPLPGAFPVLRMFRVSGQATGYPSEGAPKAPGPADW
jgi:hypothetical protein